MWIALDKNKKDESKNLRERTNKVKINQKSQTINPF